MGNDLFAFKISGNIPSFLTTEEFQLPVEVMMKSHAGLLLLSTLFGLLFSLALGTAEAEICQDCYEGTKKVGDLTINDAQCCVDGDSFCSRLDEDLTLDQDDISSCNLVSTTDGGWICDGENILYSCNPYDGTGDGDVLNQDIGGSDDDCSGIGFCPAYCSSCGNWI